MTGELDRHPFLVEACRSTAVFYMRGCARADDVTAAAHYLKASLLPSAHGWANAEFYGNTRQRGFEIETAAVARERIQRDGPPAPVLVTWREIAVAVRVAWRPEFSELHDHAAAARNRLREAADCYGTGAPIDWPPGVDHYYSLLHRIGAADKWIREQVLLGVCAQDPAFAPGQLAFL